MKRLFIAADLDVAVKQRLADFIRTLLPCGGKINFTSPENLHVTLAFLGDAQDRDIPQIISAVSDAVKTSPPFNFTVKGVKLVGPGNSPSMIWADVTNGADGLADIAQKITAALIPLGFRPERRPFNAHVTLGRIKYLSESRELAKKISVATETDFGVTGLAAVTVYESVLKPAGPTYIPLHKATLQAN